MSLQSQSELLTSMTSSLNVINDNMNKINNVIKIKAETLKSLHKKMEKSNDSLIKLNESLTVLLNKQQELKELKIQKEKNDAGGFTNPLFTASDFANIATSSLAVDTALSTQIEELVNATSVNDDQVNSTKNVVNVLDKETKKIEAEGNSTLTATKTLNETLDKTEKGFDQKIKELPKAKEVEDAASDSGPGFSLNWPVMIIKGLLFLTNAAFNAVITSIKIYTQLMKTMLTLPFTVGNNAALIGNDLRKEIVEGIGNKVEDFKENFSLSSHIGKDLKKLGVLAEESILDSKNTQSIFARTFGKENYTAALDSTKKILDGLGSLAEYVGPTITKSTDTAVYIERMQRLLGIGIDELKYYSIDAINSLSDLPTILIKNANALDKISKKQKVDFRLLSKTYHTLRKNIVEFGHLSATELGEVSAKIIKMKISAEDVVGIFGKVSSFEQASNMSAQLFQSFGMVLDAYDMLSANDPIEIINQLRDGMLSSGKQFETLNRHEKSLLKSITGLSDNTLKSVFSYENLGKSQEEIANEMETKNPTEIMTVGLQGMTDAIRQIKKVLTYNSPFKAIYAGLMENTVAQKELIDSSTKLSEAYEILQRSIMTISDKEIESFTIPLNIILRKFHRVLTDGKLGNLFGKGIATVSDFLQDLYVQSTESRVDDLINDATYMLSKLKLIKNDKTLAIYNEYKARFTGTIQEFHSSMPDEFKKIASNLGLLNEKGELNPDITLENMSQIMISALSSEDKEVSDFANKTFSVRLDFLNEIKQRLTAVLDSNKELSKELNDVIQNSEGIDGTLNKLYKGLESMLTEGTDIFQGIFKLGQSLMGGIVKGLIIGTTGLLLLLNGNIDKASETLGQHIEGLKGKNPILDLLQIDGDEFKKLTENLELASARFGNSTGDKLLPAFGFILTKLYETAGDLLDIIRPLVDSIIGTIYDTLSSGGLTQKGAAFGLKQIAGGAIARRDYNKSKEKYFDTNQESNRNDLINLLQQIQPMAYESRPTNYLDYAPGAKAFKYRTFPDYSNEVMISKYEIEEKLISLGLGELSNLTKLWIAGEEEAMPIVIKNFLEILTRNIKILQNKKEKSEKEKLTLMYQNYYFKHLTESLSKKWDDQSKTLGQMLYMIDKVLPELVKPTNDIIKLHHNDTVEVIASKQGGMLRELAGLINESVKESVNKAKMILKMATLNRKDEDYESDEDLALQLAIKLESYVDYVSSRKIKIQQNNLSILEQ